MLKESRSKTYEKLLEKAITQVQNMGYENIKAGMGEFEAPASLVNNNTKEEFVPDLTATKNGNKSYFEISEKEEDHTKLVGKWKLLGVMSQMKNGMFQVFVPKGKLMYTKTILKDHNIEAAIHKLN